MTRGAAAEEDVLGEQQLKRTQSGSSKLKRMHPAEADAVGEQH